MKTISIRVCTLLLSILLSATALAAPGWEITTFTASPLDAPKLIAALDDFMGSSGQDYPGQVTLLVNEADGTDPATHTILQTFPSAAANEAFTQRLQSSEKMSADWARFLEVMVSNSTPVQTVRGEFLRNWGDVDPSDTVWMHHFISANDAPAVVAALERWMNSDTGKKAPGQLHLSSVVAGGMGSPTHIVSVGNASQAEAEQWRDSIAGNADYQAFLAAMLEAAEYHGANLVVEVKSWGNAPAAITGNQ